LGVRLAFAFSGKVEPTQRGRGENVSTERALEFFVKRIAVFNVLACTLLCANLDWPARVPEMEPLSEKRRPGQADGQ
jgi:hypothetical protein